MGRHDLLLAQVSPELADHARRVVDWLVGDVMDFSELGQGDVQRLLWLDLPTRWSVPAAEWPAVAEAGARVFELAGRPGLAALARSEETSQVLQAYTRSIDDGVAAANDAYARTGTMPPDTDLLTWGSTLAGAEANAYDEMRRVLEAAVVAGDYRPGTPGWRQRQRALTERWLTSPSRYFDGWRPLDVIHTVRREAWSTSGTPTRCRVLAGVEPLVKDAVPTPEGEPAPLLWMLDRIGTGVRLTQRGYLPPALVREADERFDWSPPPYRATREADLPNLLELHELARQHKLVTKRHDTLRASARGRTVLDEPSRLWEMAAVAWLGDHAFDIRVAEIAAALLVKGPAPADNLAATAHEAIAPEFRTRDGGLIPIEATTEAVWRWIRRGLALGFVEPQQYQRSTLSGVGRLAALTSLRLRSQATQR